MFAKFLAVVLVGAGAVSAAHADRLINIPTARHLFMQEAKFEYLSEAGNARTYRLYAQYGMTDAFEVTLRETDFRGERAVQSANIQYQLVPVLPGILPGISIGILDVGDSTPRKAAGFLTITHEIPIEGPYAIGRDFILHFGLGINNINGAFFGFEYPLTQSVTYVAEWDSRHINTGFEWAPFQFVRLRAALIEERPHLGIMFRHQF